MKVANVKVASEIEAQLSEDIGSEAFALLAHDIRSSMFGMLGSLEMIETEGLPEETKKRLERARASGALLNDLMKLVFGDEAKEKLVAPLDVTSEIKLLVQRWYDEIEVAQIDIDVKFTSERPKLVAIDRVNFHRVFNNIIGNAIKHSKNGEISILIEIAGDYLIISVSDTGTGFSDDALELLFEFGGRPEDSPHHGTGLGLYISHGIVSDSGGVITAENNSTVGACVTVKLPVFTGDLPTTVKLNLEELPDLSHLNILLAEDNVTNQLVVTQMLQSMGARFQIASDGVEALKMFEKEQFDAVLLDIEMPRKSGLEVLREIRSREDGRAGTPLIALTAYVMQEHRDRIDAAGADGVIAKPIAGIAALGHQILEFTLGNSSAGEMAEVVADIKVSEDTGTVDRSIFDVLLKTIGSDFRNEFLEKVILDFENIRNGLIEAEANNDFAELRAKSHILISISGAIGALELQTLAQELNATARSGLMQNAKPLSSECIKGVTTILSFLSEEIS